MVDFCANGFLVVLNVGGSLIDSGNVWLSGVIVILVFSWSDNLFSERDALLTFLSSMSTAFDLYCIYPGGTGMIFPSENIGWATLKAETTSCCWPRLHVIEHNVS